eukprot:613361-Pleurochrysis_carterae.AAC.1
MQERLRTRATLRARVRRSAHARASRAHVHRGCLQSCASVGADAACAGNVVRECSGAPREAEVGKLQLSL